MLWIISLPKIALIFRKYIVKILLHFIIYTSAIYLWLYIHLSLYEWGIWIEKQDREVEGSFFKWGKFSKENLNTENSKYQTSLLQRENTFTKTELNSKQHIIEKFLNINNNQSKVNDINITDNAHVNKNCSVFENSSKNKGNPSKNVKDQNKSGKPNLDFNKRNPRKKKLQSLVILW